MKKWYISPKLSDFGHKLNSIYEKSYNFSIVYQSDNTINDAHQQFENSGNPGLLHVCIYYLLDAMQQSAYEIILNDSFNLDADIKEYS